jgi:5-methylcytosine-specific restriction endonuclease McrA
MISEARKKANRKFYLSKPHYFRDYAKAFRVKHRTRLAIADKARYQIRRERVLKQKAEHYQKHKLERQAYNRKYFKANRLKLANRSREVRKKDAVKIRIRNREYMRSNPSRVRAWTKAWMLKNPHKQREYDARRRSLEASSVINTPALKAFYQFVRNRERVKCYYCSDQIDGKDAHVDHVIALSRGGNHASENLAVSCPKCNQSKNNKLPQEWDRHSQIFLNL